MRSTTILLLILIIYSGCTRKSYVTEKPIEAGKCFEKCFIKDSHEYGIEVERPEYSFHYTGNNIYQEGIEVLLYELAPATTKWIKKKADKNCLSANPDDCLVWCLTETPAQHKEIYVVTDTTKIKEWKEPKVKRRKIWKQAYRKTEWKEVLCTEHPEFPELILTIQEALIDLSYDIEGRLEENFGPKTQAAIIQFQKENDLPLGQLDLETLDLLGVAY